MLKCQKVDVLTRQRVSSTLCASRLPEPRRRRGLLAKRAPRLKPGANLIVGNDVASPTSATASAYRRASASSSSWSKMDGSAFTGRTIARATKRRLSLPERVLAARVHKVVKGLA